MYPLREFIKLKRRGKLTKGTPVHKSRVSEATIAESSFLEVNDPPYIPDLAPLSIFYSIAIASRRSQELYKNKYFFLF